MNEDIITAGRTPEIIAVEIRTLSSQFKQQALSYAIEIGRRLCEAKDLVNHGEWGTWIEEKTEFSHQTANNLMKVFRDYGADQISLDGAAKSKTLGNLSYTKALALLQVPADEREEFAETVGAVELSTRELEAAIRERDEAKKLAKEAETSMAAADKKVATLKTQLDGAQKDAKKAGDEAAKLRDQLKELREKPIDVAVQEPDEDAIAKVVEEALQGAQAEKDKAEARVKELEKALAVADPGVAKFAALFEETQTLLSKLVGLIGTAPDEKRDGLRRSLRALFDTFGGLVA
jgi:exonuclease VII small subunit